MKLLTTILALLLISLTALQAQSDLMGFEPASAELQLALEKEFDQQLQAQNLDTWMKHLSAHPHHVGSPWDKEVVDYMAARFKEWGYKVKVEEFQNREVALEVVKKSIIDYQEYIQP